MTPKIPPTYPYQSSFHKKVSIHFFSGKSGVIGSANIVDGRFLIQTDSTKNVELGEIAIASISRPTSGVIRQIVEVVGINEESLIFNVVAHKRNKSL